MDEQIENTAKKTTIITRKQAVNSLITAVVVVLILSFLPFNIGVVLSMPVRYLTTYAHELSHAFMTIITGGQIDVGAATGIGIDPNGGGVTYSRGGWSFFILNAGYVGAVLLGAGALLLTLKTKATQFAFYMMTGIALVTALLWVRPIFSFSFFITLVVSGFLFVIGHYAKSRLSLFLLQYIAVHWCWFAVSDIIVLIKLVLSGNVENDAVFLAQRTMMPAIVWAFIWLIASAGILFLAGRKLLCQPKTETALAEKNV